MEIHHDFEKKVSESIKMVHFIQRERAFKIIDNQHTINGAIAEVYMNGNEFECKIFLNEFVPELIKNEFEGSGLRDEIVLESSGDKFLIKKDSVKSLSTLISTPQVLKLELIQYQYGTTEDFQNKRFRLMIPIEAGISFSILQSKSIKIENTTALFGLVPVKFGKNEFHIFCYKNDDSKEQYLIIDSLLKDSFENFENSCGSIITALGFLTGDLILDQYFFI